MKKYTVDQFESNNAILILRSDEEIQVHVQREQLPKETREGDIINVKLDAKSNIIDAIILKEETATAKKRADELLQKILEKNN